MRPTYSPAPTPAATTTAPARPEVVAHRGASADAPENTLAAVDEAIRQGADVIEVDVRCTADGHLVLLHDSGPARTTDVARVFPDRALAPAGAFTLAELKQLDAGSWAGPLFTGEPVPTLAELVVRTWNRAGLLIELKEPGAEAEVARVLGAPRPGVVVQSFDHDAMRRFRAVAPGVPVGWLVEDRPTDAELDAAVAGGADQVNPAHEVVDADLVAAVHARRMRIGVWTVNDDADLRRMRDAGVDRIITDRPGALRSLSTP